MKSSAWASYVYQYAGLGIVLVLLVTFFSTQTDHFFQWSTVVAIANRIPELTFVAVGMTFVLVIGGIDLSVGSIIALGSATMAILITEHQWPLILALGAAIMVTGFTGTLNGFVAVGFGIPSFIVTLGMMWVARGATRALTDSQTIYVGSKIEAFGQPLPGIDLSPAFITACAVVLIAQLVLQKTVFGRYCMAIGTNRKAVRLSGIRLAPYSIAVFVLSGLLCGIASFARASRMSSADPNAAIGIELLAIAACVIGGTSLIGGRGSTIATFLGVLIIEVLQTGLAQMGVSDASKQIITGLVIIVAVIVDALRSRAGRRQLSD